jgi:hypothetical protein
MSGPDEGWPERVSTWVNSRDDIKAFVQIGSRVQKDGSADSWSDFDYQLITTRPGRYLSGDFAAELGACWAYGSELSFGNVVKVTAVFDGALEADFVIISHLDMLIATAALRWPSTEPLWPRVLAAGVKSLRVVAAPGWKVIKGGRTWERRYAQISPQAYPMTSAEFSALCGEFWVQLVWAAKKAQRGELIASRRAFHRYLVENCLRICQEEAVLDGRKAFPLGRHAEQWLAPGQLGEKSAGTGPEKAALMASLERISEDFARASSAVAVRNGWPFLEYREIRAWLAALLSPN